MKLAFFYSHKVERSAPMEYRGAGICTEVFFRVELAPAELRLLHSGSGWSASMRRRGSEEAADHTDGGGGNGCVDTVGDQLFCSGGWPRRGVGDS